MQELTLQQCMLLLEEEDVAHIGVVSDGKPYVTPVSYVTSGTELLFRTEPGRRLEAITEHPFVCVEVTSYDRATGDWKSVVAWGEARLAGEDDVQSAEVVALLMNKYREVMGNPLSLTETAPLSQPSIVLIKLENVTGRSSGVGLSPRTRPGRL